MLDVIAHIDEIAHLVPYLSGPYITHWRKSLGKYGFTEVTRGSLRRAFLSDEWVIKVERSAPKINRGPWESRSIPREQHIYRMTPEPLRKRFFPRSFFFTCASHVPRDFILQERVRPGRPTAPEQEALVDFFADNWPQVSLNDIGARNCGYTKEGRWVAVDWEYETYDMREMRRSGRIAMKGDPHALQL